MKTGNLKHSHLGPCKARAAKGRRFLELRCERQQIGIWLQNYERLRKFEWDLCFFPECVEDEETQNFKPNQEAARYKIIRYSGQYVSSLQEEISNRAKNGALFSASNILYVLLSTVKAWREWQKSCQEFKHPQKSFGISSQHLLLDSNGDIKLVTEVSSPFALPQLEYYAPENIPPERCQDIDSWNKSISFSLGLIGYEMLSLRLGEPFYTWKEGRRKFDFEQYEKWLGFAVDSYRQKSMDRDCINQVINIIKLLTERNPYFRLKLGELEALLETQQHSILNGEEVQLQRQECRASLLEYISASMTEG